MHRVLLEVTSLENVDRRNASDVVGVARRLFAELGYDQTTSEMIARSAGVATSVIAEEFGGKRGLYEQVQRQILTQSRKGLESILEEEGLSSADKFHKVLDRLLDYICDNPDDVAIWKQRQMGDAADIDDTGEEYADPVVAAIVDLGRSVFHEDVDVQLMVWTAIWSTESFFFSRFRVGVGRGASGSAEAARFRRHIHALVEPFFKASGRCTPS
jgi:AcrR family transcriptional regulator